MFAYMKAKVIQLFFLVIAGLIISWREWTNAASLVSNEVEIASLQAAQEVGSNTEASTVLAILLAGTILAIVVNGMWGMVPSKLSSPNSV